MTHPRPAALHHVTFLLAVLLAVTALVAPPRATADDAPVSAASTACNRYTFTDLPGVTMHSVAASWYAQRSCIRHRRQAGYPDGTFRTAVTVTRDQFASFAVIASKVNTSTVNRFPDVASSSPHRTFINGLGANGAFQGYPDGTFRPALTVTRGQVYTVIARLTGYYPPNRCEAARYLSGIRSPDGHRVVPVYPTCGDYHLDGGASRGEVLIRLWHARARI